MLNLYDANAPHFSRTKNALAARQYFLEHVNQEHGLLHNQDEKLDYLVRENYYEREVLDQLLAQLRQVAAGTAPTPRSSGSRPFWARSSTTRPTPLKTFDGGKRLPRAVRRPGGDGGADAGRRRPPRWPRQLVDEIIDGRFQPATPTFLQLGQEASAASR